MDKLRWLTLETIKDLDQWAMFLKGLTGIPEKIIRGMIEKGWVCYSDHVQKRMGDSPPNMLYLIEKS